MQLLGKVFLWLFLLLSIFACSTSGKSFEEDVTLSVDEKTMLEKFKERFINRVPKEYMKKDIYLIRWLRARYFNFEEAEKMFSNHLEWWQDNGMDTIDQEDWSDLENEYKFWAESQDKEGRPMIYINFGHWDFRKAALTGQTKRFMRYIDYVMEKSATRLRDFQDKYQNVSQGIVMLNVAGFNLVQHGCLQCVPLMLRIIGTYEAHYPGTAEKVIILNYPLFAQPIQRAARLAFHSDTNKALNVIGTNQQKLKEYLSKYFDWDQLPPEIGGTKLYSGMETDY